MMALGIPGDIITAVMLGALLIHDVVPSPAFIAEEPKIAYAIFIAFFFANFLVLGLQTGALRGFVLITKVRMYVLASVILVYCGIGVFSLNNITNDMWTLAVFGVIGYTMRNLKFPLAPMILGVVLGPIAERWLSRSLALSTDVSEFFTHPWSLFFIIASVFSIGFSWYQAQRGKKVWTLWYAPALLLAMTIPLFMMGGSVRSIIAGLMIVLALILMVKIPKAARALRSA